MSDTEDEGPAAPAAPAPSSDGEDGDGDDKLLFVNAILIALITVVAALVAWRASVAGDATGDYDYDGLKAVVASEEVRTLGTVEALTHAQAFANYRRYDETVFAINEELQGASGKDAAELVRKKREADLLVDAKLRMFPNKFIERAKNDESTYNTKREIGQYVANKKRTRDLVPEAHFKSAEAFRSKTEKLLRGVVLLTLALVCFTLVEALEGAARKASFAAGLLLGIAGTVYSIAMELAKYE